MKRKEALKERIIKEMCKKEEVGEEELRLGGQRQRVSRVRSKIAWRLSREYGIPLAKIAQGLRGVHLRYRQACSINGGRV